MSDIIQWEGEGVFLHFSKTLDLGDITRCNDEMYKDARLDNADYQIWDFTEVENIKMDADEAKVPAVIDKGASVSIPNLKIALVAINEDVIELCYQYIETSTKLHSTWKFQVCQKLEDARNWIAA